MTDVRKTAPTSIPGAADENLIAKVATAAVAAVGTSIGVGLAVSQLLNRRRVAADESYVQLTQEPLAGTPLRCQSADGTELYAEVHGPPDAPTVVLVPGWTETMRFFDPVARLLLAEGFRVVCCDLRGQGHSQLPPDHDQRIERYGEDIEAQLQCTCSHRDDVIVAGHSMGGMSIVAWAQSHDVRARVRGAALMNTGMVDLMIGSGILPHVPGPVRSQIGSRVILGGFEPLPKGSTPALRALLRYGAFGPDASPGMIEFVERMTHEMPIRNRASAGRTLKTLNIAAGLPDLTVPTTVIAGDADKLTPATHAQQMAADLPDLLELLIVPRAGHMAPLEHPREIAAALERLAVHVGLQTNGSGDPVAMVSDAPAAA